MRSGCDSRSLSLISRHLAALTGFFELRSELVTIEGVSVYNSDTLELLQKFSSVLPSLDTLGIELYRYESVYLLCISLLCV